MAYGKPGKLIRRVQKSIRKRKKIQAEKVRLAKAIAKKTAAAQRTIAKTEKVTAGKLLGSGDWEWEGSGMSPDTVVEAVWNGSNWEYVPTKRQPRKAALANDPASAPKQCRGKTKNGTPCERIGNCPVRSHKRNKV